MVAGQVSWLPAHCACSVTFPPESSGSGFACYLLILQAITGKRWPDTVARPHRFCTDFPILLVTSHPATVYTIQLANNSIAFLAGGVKRTTKAKEGHKVFFLSALRRPGAVG